MTQNKNKIWKIMLITAIIILGTNSIFARSVRAPQNTQTEINMGYLKVMQADGNEIELITFPYPNGYIIYRNMDGYTAVFDSLSDNWCYATKNENSRLKSTGFPLHLHNGRELGIRQTLMPSDEEIEEFEQKSENSNEQKIIAFEEN